MKKTMILLVAALTLSACNSVKDKQSQVAYDAANSLVFTGNAEIDNIKHRLELTSNPAQIGYVLLLNQSGQPIAYYVVKGKVTSSSKRLTSGADNSPNDEGTYGSSDPYVYFWDTFGIYHQWSGTYLFSDKPIRLSVKPLVITAVK